MTNDRNLMYLRRLGLSRFFAGLVRDSKYLHEPREAENVAHAPRPHSEAMDELYNLNPVLG